jgi:hypothetical protein
MSTPTTNYLVYNPNAGLYQDLGSLAVPRVSTDPKAAPDRVYYL